MGSTRNRAIKVAYTTFTILFPTRVVVRKVSGFLVKNPIELEMRLFFLEATSSLSLFAVTKAISDPEKNPLNKIVPVIRSHSIY